MAVGRSFITYTGDGSTVDFTFNFQLGYISVDQIHCYLNDIETTDFTVDTILDKVTFTTPPAVDDVILIRRQVDTTELIHDYADGAIIIEQNLDESNLQPLMAVHEVLDGFVERQVGSLDMSNGRIINLADPIDDTDAVNKQYADQVLTAATAAVNPLVTAAQAAQAAAELAEDGAQAAETAAVVAQGAAETAQTGAETAQTGAETAQAAAEAALASFNGIYYGALASAPVGADVSDLYYDTTSSSLYILTSTGPDVWQAFGVSTMTTGTETIAGAAKSVFTGLTEIISGMVSIHVNGIHLDEGTDFTVQAGTGFTLTVQAEIDDVVSWQFVTSAFSIADAATLAQVTALVPTKATQATVDAGTDNDQFLTPATFAAADATLKHFCVVDQTGTQNITDSMNITSIVDGGTGVTTFNFGKTYSTNLSYGVTVGDGYPGYGHTASTTRGTTSVTLSMISQTGTGVDQSISMAVTSTE